MEVVKDNRTEFSRQKGALRTTWRAILDRQLLLPHMFHAMQEWRRPCPLTRLSVRAGLLLLCQDGPLTIGIYACSVRASSPHMIWTHLSVTDMLRSMYFGLTGSHNSTIDFVHWVQVLP